MKKWTALLLMLVMLCGAALADTEINVTGSGETVVRADTAVITLGVEARDADVQKAQTKVNEAMNAIRTALAEMKVEEEDINTASMNIYTMYDYPENGDPVTVYHAGTSLSIRVRDMDLAGKVIDAAFGAGANTLNGISFSSSEEEAAKKTSLQQAVADARSRAEVIAEAAGLKITGIETISDNGVFSYDNSSRNIYAEKSMADEAGGTVVQAAKLVVSASVSIVFKAE